MRTPMRDAAGRAARPTLGAALRQATAACGAPASTARATTRAGCWSRALGLSARQVLARPERPLSAAEAESFAPLHRPSRRARAGIAHPRRARVLWPQLCHLAGNARSAARQRDPDRGRPRVGRRGGLAGAAAAHPGRRHRLGVPAAYAAGRAAAARWASARTRARRPWTSRAPTPQRLGLAPTGRNGSRPMRSRPSAARSIS